MNPIIHQTRENGAEKSEAKKLKEELGDDFDKWSDFLENDPNFPDEITSGDVFQIIEEEKGKGENRERKVKGKKIKGSPLQILEDKNNITSEVEDILGREGINVDDITIINLDNNIIAYVDYDKKAIFIKASDGGLIGSIGQSEYHYGFFQTDEHLFFDVEKKYRGKFGWGSKIYNLYKKIHEISPEFILPETEYSNTPSKIRFYQKNGFKIKGKISPQDRSCNILFLKKEDFALIEENLKELKDGKGERKLSYTVVLEKED